MNSPAQEQLLQQGRYRIDSEVCNYSDSVVYSAYDTHRQAKVIIKEIISPSVKVLTATQQENININFANEAKALSDIRHDSLLNIEDYFSEIGRKFIVMELTEATDLFQLVEKNNGPFTQKQVVAWANQILSGVDFLHSQEPPVIHKNIWPQNVLVDVDGKAKLIGHGLNDTLNTSMINESHKSTLLNFAPLEQLWWDLDPASQKVIAHSFDEQSEKILMQPADVRTDLYLAGATIYFLLTAKLPIGALERSIDLLDGKRDPLMPPEKLNPAVSERISDIVLRAMEIKREDRFESAFAMQHALKVALSRVEEFETDEQKEQEEAAADLRRAAELKNEQFKLMLEQKQTELEQEQKRQAALMEQKLREAEEQRLLAEQRAFEAEQLLKEKEAEAAKLAAIQLNNALPPEEDLLGISDAPNPIFQNAVSQPFNASTTEANSFNNVNTSRTFGEFGSDNLTPVKPFTEAVMIADEQVARPEFGESSFTANLYQEPEKASDNIGYASFADLSEHIKPSKDEEVEFAFSSENRSAGMPKAMIAGASLVLLVLFIGAGWYVLSALSGTGSAAESPASAPIVESKPEEVKPPVQEEQIVSETVPAEVAEPVQPTNDQELQVADNKPAEKRPVIQQTAAQNARKPQPAKPAEKKKVTVDDLINDL